MAKRRHLRSTREVLVTGATGFVGSNLVRRLISQNFQVHILIRKTSKPGRISDISTKLKTYEVDLVEAVKLKKIVQKINPKIIFHLAAKSIFSSQKEDNHQEIIKSNFLGTVNLIQALQDVDYQCFANIGSSSEYGIKNHPMRESDVCQPVNVYGVSKLSSTVFAQMIANIYQKPIITLRLFSPFGPFDDQRRLIANTIVSALKNRDLFLTQPSVVRDYIFVDDVVNACLVCISKTSKFSEEIFNIGSGQQQTIGEVVTKITKLTNSKSRLLWGKLPVINLEPKIWQADLTKTEKLLGWKPKYSLDEGILKTVEWFKKNLDLYN